MNKSFFGATPLIACWLLVSSVALADEEESDADKQLEVGQRAIEFELPAVTSDEYVSLRDEYKQGPVVVVVLRGYPGHQCPICNQQVGSLINRAKVLGENAHRVILVYPGESDSLEKRAKQFLGSRRIPDPLVLVRDDEMAMVNSWGLRWNRGKETAYPSTFVIDRNGRVRWKKVSTSHAGRSRVEEILKELRKL